MILVCYCGIKRHVPDCPCGLPGSLQREFDEIAKRHPLASLSNPSTFTSSSERGLPKELAGDHDTTARLMQGFDLKF
jgi:hypothetical protein